MEDIQANQKSIWETGNYSRHEGEEGKYCRTNITKKLQAGHKEPGMEDTVTRMGRGFWELGEVAKELISSSWALRWPTDTRKPFAYLLCHSMSVTSQCRIVLKNLSPENPSYLLGFTQNDYFQNVS